MAGTSFGFPFRARSRICASRIGLSSCVAKADHWTGGADARPEPDVTGCALERLRHQCGKQRVRHSAQHHRHAREWRAMPWRRAPRCMVRTIRASVKPESIWVFARCAVAAIKLERVRLPHQAVANSPRLTAKITTLRGQRIRLYRVVANIAVDLGPRAVRPGNAGVASAASSRLT